MDMLPYRFAYRLHRILTIIEERANRRISKYGLRVQSLRVLLWLYHGGKQSFADLAERTSFDPSALSHILRRMAAGKLVVRERADNDNRAVNVSLTAQGRKLAEKLAPEFKNYDRSLVTGFTDAECDALQTLLDRVFTNVAKPQ